MKIETEIFKRSDFLFSKLEPYGFQKEGENYLFKKNILDDTFQVLVIVSSFGKVSLKIYDLVFQDEYTNFRVEKLNGNFVNTIREEVKNILNDIKNNCTKDKYFFTEQANRLTELIKKQYGDCPEFLWQNSPHGVFRNKKNKKWYGIIMNINKNKLTSEDKEIEILNIKLPKEEIKELLKQKGFYKAYHMNKENWLTIILDDTLKDDVIMSYLDQSYQFTEEIKEWLIPANPKYYDVINCFSNKDTIIWKQPSNISIHDIVYLYLGSPYSKIIYKCLVVEIDIPYQYQDKNLTIKKAMKIKLLKRYDDTFTLAKLQEYGIKSIRGPRSITKELSNKLQEVE